MVTFNETVHRDYKTAALHMPVPIRNLKLFIESSIDKMLVRGLQVQITVQQLRPLYKKTVAGRSPPVDVQCSM